MSKLSRFTEKQQYRQTNNPHLQTFPNAILKYRAAQEPPQWGPVCEGPPTWGLQTTGIHPKHHLTQARTHLLSYQYFKSRSARYGIKIKIKTHRDIHTETRTHTETDTHTHAYTQTRTHTDTDTHRHGHTYTRTYPHTVFISLCLSVSVSVCLSVCLSVCHSHARTTICAFFRRVSLLAKQHTTTTNNNNNNN